MKILLDGRLYGLENAGLGRYLVNLVDQISKLDKSDEFVILLRKKYFNLLEFPKNWKKVLADFRHYSIKEQFEIPAIIRKQNPDLVHFPHFNVPLFCPKPFVVTIHDMLMHSQSGIEASTLNPFIYFFKRLGYKLIFRHAVLKSVRIIVPSETVKNEVSGFYRVNKNKITVTYEGSDPSIKSEVSFDSLAKKFKINKPYFLYVGNAYPHKNLRLLVKAIVHLNELLKEKANLVIVSSRNVFLARLQKLVSQIKSDKYVKILGHLEDNQLGTLYKNSEGFVFPSLSEGFGLPGLEAINSGTLLLVSDIPVFREVYPPNTFFFNPHDAFSIASGMKLVLETGENKRLDIIRNSQDFIKRYSWAKMARETIDTYAHSSRIR